MGLVGSRWTTKVDGLLGPSDARPSDDVGLALQWLGTAGFRVVSRGHHLWLDPHLSRHSPLELTTSRIAPKLANIQRDVDRAHAVMVGHSHFDHALDAPAIAMLHGARVYGAEDTLNWCRGYGVPANQLVRMEGRGESYDEGPFRLRPVRSQHSPFLAGRVPFPGPIARPLPGPAPVWSWRVGQVFGLYVQGEGPSVYHVGSADLIEVEMLGIQADVVLCCTIGRHSVKNFTQRVVKALRPKWIVPCHWDQFWTPLDAPPRQIPTNDLAGFLEEVAACDEAPQVRVLPPRGWAVLKP